MGWLLTTRTPMTQRGLVLLQAAKGDLRLLINELSLEVLTKENGGQAVLAHVKSACSWALVRLLPRRIEECIFGPSAARQRGETLLQYSARKLQLWRELDNAGCTIPDAAKAYITFKHANMSEKQQEALVQAVNGNWTVDEVVSRLRQAERPGILTASGAGKHFQESEQDTAECWCQTEEQDQEGSALVSPYVVPEADLQYWMSINATAQQNDDSMLIPWDYATGVVEEDDAVAVFATFAAVRRERRQERKRL
eukprot:1947929-Amphidinium_carterae.2